MEGKNKTTAGLLAIFLGAYGAHHFYLGNSNKGLLYLLLSLFTGIGALIFGIMGLIEGIQYFSMSDEEFAQRFSPNAKIAAPVQTKELSDVEKYQLIKGYKNLLDSGALTQSEFDAIKQQLMK